jgi:hypothetical protein
VAAGDELLEARDDALGQLTGSTRADALLEDRKACALFLLVVMNEELAQHADTRSERGLAGTRAEESLERVTKERMLLERTLFGSMRSLRERIDQLLFREGVTDDFVGERTEQVALRCFLGPIEEIDDATMLFFENVFER